LKELVCSRLGILKKKVLAEGGTGGLVGARGVGWCWFDGRSGRAHLFESGLVDFLVKGRVRTRRI